MAELSLQGGFSAFGILTLDEGEEEPSGRTLYHAQLLLAQPEPQPQ